MASPKIRIYIVGWSLILGGALIVSRLFAIQVIDNKRYTQISNKQTERRIMIPATRGNIVDRKGAYLATTVDARIKISNGMLESSDTGDQVRSRAFSQVKRLYPQRDLAGSVLGWVGKDGYGMGGIEYAFDKYLGGENGWMIVSKDARNRQYRKPDLPQKAPRNGATVYLTIDSEIQKIVQNVLRKAIDSLQAREAMAIVMDPYTGEILAMANEPSFNPNIAFAFSQDARSNRCIGFNYEPGSTFKVFTATAALGDKIKTEGDMVFGNNGVFEIYGEKIRDHEPHGYLTFTQALAVSSNVCFAKIATEVGNERLYRYARNFGFGERTGIELPGEETGIVHPIDKWSGRTCVTMAIGQEVSVTLLQMMSAFGAVANGGVLVKPRICKKVVDDNGVVVDSIPSVPVRRVLSQDVAMRLRRMMSEVVISGTGMEAGIKGLPVAGKTGTSQKIDSATGTYSNNLVWASFIGFAPVENPVLLCGVVVDEPARNGFGGQAAAPAFRRIVQQVISNPTLEFAEKMVPDSAKAHTQKIARASVVPDVRGSAVAYASQLVKSMGFRSVVVGNGPAVIDQSPAPGTRCALGIRLSLVTTIDSTSDTVSHVAANGLPDCRGMDVRAALRVLYLKGVTPYIVGAGTVRQQRPSGGVMFEKAMPCTLHCSFEG